MCTQVLALWLVVVQGSDSSCPHPLPSTPQILMSRPREEWKADVMTRYKALSQFSKEDARVQYLRIIRSLPYGEPAATALFCTGRRWGGRQVAGAVGAAGGFWCAPCRPHTRSCSCPGLWPSPTKTPTPV